MSPSGLSPLPAAASPAGGPQATDARFPQLQALYGQLTARVTAVEKDVGWALFELRADLYLDLALIAPVLPALAGQGAAAEIARAILDVSAWWP